MSQLTANVAKSFETQAIFESLFSKNGSDIATIPATRVCRPGEMLTFRELSNRVREVRCLLLGWKSSFYR